MGLMRASGGGGRGAGYPRRMLYLASQSPRRRELLGRLDVPFSVVDVDVPEIPMQGESARDYVCRVAREKAIAGWTAIGGSSDDHVIGSDTEVVLDGVVFGKPVNADDAVRMLRQLSGRTHQVFSAVSLVGAVGGRDVLSVTEVGFDALDDATIAAYVRTGEPMGKAGAYAIQGRAERFVRHLAGSYSGVMGLPLFETARLLSEAGISSAAGNAPPVDASSDHRAGMALTGK